MDNVLVDFQSALQHVVSSVLDRHAENKDNIPGIFSLMTPMPGAVEAFEELTARKRQNQLNQEHIDKIISTYQQRQAEPRYSRRVEMAEIEKNDYNLNISRYISTAVAEAEIDLGAIHGQLLSLEQDIHAARDQHNGFLEELGLPLLP